MISIRFDQVLRQLKLNILVLFLIEIFEEEGNNWCFNNCIEKLYVGRKQSCFLLFPTHFQLVRRKLDDVWKQIKLTS